ncbi:MAG: Ppx/GppA family phosphatase [Candidatus Accumulibacter sp.]|jgi:exopolyphosphatase/guanosine-5'-triphosphate,3'-diphosphate pyrophosphatase|nr:Ppx/GppA family phosphatase [Accumulibacter sp.]
MGYEQIAAVDLGSNSFCMQVGRIVEEQIYPLDARKESVRLASGLTPDKDIDEAAQSRALETLSRFGERLRGFQPEAVRVVATNTFRVAKNAKPFISRAEKALGFPIEIVAGREEARLVYLGASQALPSRERRLVVDIGGGSTEFIVGRQTETFLMESLFMGCVSYSLRFFSGGRVDKKSFNGAEMAAASELQAISKEFRSAGWTEAVATSGTAHAISTLLEANGLNPGGIDGITHEGLSRLKTLLIRAGSADEVRLSGLRADRTPVFPGGLAIMLAIFTELGVQRMLYSEGALRLGVLYDLLGRFQDRDMRDLTVQEFMKRYQVETAQARRVSRMALTLLAQLMPGDSRKRETSARFLRWAADLHEIGISVAHNGFHRHGAYIVTYADMPGFSRRDQEYLSTLILGQRGKLEKIPFSGLPDPARTVLFCLRMAVLLHRSRDDLSLPAISVRQTGNGFFAGFREAWLSANPLTEAALREEASIWERAGYPLRIGC